MDIRELTALQQKAINVFTKFHAVDFDDAHEVWSYLQEIHPFMTNINLVMPKEQLFLLLYRHGYGNFSHNEVYNAITNLMIDMNVEELLNTIQMKQSRPALIH